MRACTHNGIRAPSTIKYFHFMSNLRHLSPPASLRLLTVPLALRLLLQTFLFIVQRLVCPALSSCPAGERPQKGLRPSSLVFAATCQAACHPGRAPVQTGAPLAQNAPPQTSAVRRRPCPQEKRRRTATQVCVFVTLLWSPFRSFSTSYAILTWSHYLYLKNESTFTRRRLLKEKNNDKEKRPKK